MDDLSDVDSFSGESQRGLEFPGDDCDASQHVLDLLPDDDDDVLAAPGAANSGDDSDDSASAHSREGHEPSSVHMLSFRLSAELQIRGSTSILARLVLPIVHVLLYPGAAALVPSRSRGQDGRWCPSDHNEFLRKLRLAPKHQYLLKRRLSRDHNSMTGQLQKRVSALSALGAAWDDERLRHGDLIQGDLVDKAQAKTKTSKRLDHTWMSTAGFRQHRVKGARIQAAISSRTGRHSCYGVVSSTI